VRKSEFDVPESMLKQIDKIAARACRDDKGRAHQKIKRLANMMDVWETACRQLDTMPVSGKKPTVPNIVFEEVGQRRGISWPTLRTQWGRWWQDESAATERRDVFAGVSSIFKTR
jgi:hypothetical protein